MSAERIATAVLKTMAEEALSAVPVVGPVLNFGVGLAQNLADEFAEDRGVSVEDVASALHSLPFGEARRIADEAMRSPAGVTALSGLSEAEREGVRHQLVGLPGTLEDMLEEIGRRDQKARFAQLSRLPELHATLVERIGAEDHKAAYKLIDQILAIKPRDALALKAQRFIDRRIGRRRLVPRMVTAFVVGALLAAAVPTLAWQHRASNTSAGTWHLSSGAPCNPYLPTYYGDPCLRDSEAALPFPKEDAALLAGVGGLALALLAGLISTGLSTRRLLLIWAGTRRRRVARAS